MGLLTEHFCGDGDKRRAATDAYVFLMLLLFPLFTGFSGYANLTASKFAFFSGLTLLWLAALVVLTAKDRSGLPKPSLSGCCALLFIALCCLSALFSEYGSVCIFGGGRYDGLVSYALYALIFLGVSFFGGLRPCHTIAFGVSVTVCCVVSAMQLLGINALWLFPGDYCYYDAHIKFTSEFLGTIGNADLLASMLCLSIPLFFYLPSVCASKLAYLSLIPLFLSTLILAVSKVAGGLVALFALALISAPLMLTDILRLKTSLVCLAVCAAASALALGFDPSYQNGALSLGFAFSGAVCALLALTFVCAAASAAISGKKFQPSTKSLRLFFAGVSLIIAVSSFLLLWFWKGESGSVYEISQALHGRLDDSFGSSRIRIWRRVMALVKERPLLGGGPGTLALKLDIEFSRFVPETGETLVSFADNAHNEYLQVLSDVGIPGLLSYLGIFSGAFAECRVRLSNRLRAPFALAVLCCAFHGFFGLGLCITAPLLWIFLGLSASRV